MGILSSVDDVLNSAKSGNFEDALNKTKGYAEDAAKKSAERLEISRKKIELLDSKTKLVKAYEKYGKLMFSKLEGNDVSQDDVDAAVEEIQLHKSRADMLGAEVDDLKTSFMETIKQHEDFFRRDKADDIDVTATEQSTNA